MDPVWLKEKLANCCLKFEIHDKDELNLNEVKKNVNLIEIKEEDEESEEEEVEKGKGKKGKGKYKKGKAKKGEKEQDPKNDKKGKKDIVEEKVSDRKDGEYTFRDPV